MKRQFPAPVSALGALLLASALAVTAVAQPGRGPGAAAMFDAMDEDGDGRIGPGEFEPPRLGRGADQREQADSDGDDRISRAEHDAMQADRARRMAERADAMFEAMDADGDGYITDAEARQQAFERFDADGDGHITEDEFTRMRDRRPGMKPRRPE
ncbi:MAG: EF-hand domain-containing protein [Pseudohaliea sp.]